MSQSVNRETYEKLLAENLEWLDRQPRSLEREHIRAILLASAALIYEPHDPEEYLRQKVQP